MNMKKSKAKSANADIEVRVQNALGASFRALVEKRNKKVTYLCQRIRGAFTKDRKIAKPLTELLASGEYTLPYSKHRKLAERLFKVALIVPERKEAAPPRPEKDVAAPPETQEQGDAEIEAALWQQIEEERAAGKDKAETSVAAMEASIVENEVGEAPAAEEAPALGEALPKRHKTCNIILSGESRARAIPEGHVLKAGDRLLRTCKKGIVEVVARDNGYEWEGEIYPTLTHISWKATGYQIGGNTFFGLPVKRRGK